MSDRQISSLIIMLLCLFALSILLNIGFVTKEIIVKDNCESSIKKD